MKRKKRARKLFRLKVLAVFIIKGIGKIYTDSRNWLWIVIGLILTKIAVKSAYTMRGYLAYGGEWLILPLMLMLREVTRSMGDIIRFLFGEEDGYGSDGD